MKFLVHVTVSILAFSLIGCAGPVGITREGYKPPNEEALGQECDCNVAIVRNASFRENEAEILGSVSVYDTGFSVVCDEQYVLELLSQEACALGADLVHIVKDKQPDWLSSCYRADANFLLLKDRHKATGLASDARYDWSLVKERARRGREATENAVVHGSFATFGIVGAAFGSTVEATPSDLCEK